MHISDMQRNELRALLFAARNEAKAFEDLTEEIESEENDISVTDAQVHMLRKQTKPSFIVLLFLGLLLLILAGALSILDIGFRVLFAAWGLILPVFGILNYRSNKKRHKKLQLSCGQAQAELAELNRKRDALSLEQVWLVPDNYRYSMALDKMLEYLDDGLTRDWAGAVALYKEQLHRWQLEINSAEALELSRQTMIAAQAAQRNAGAAAGFAAWGAMRR
ncbi:MAG: hypothetical protein FWD06_09265 [Oscillospiraceae bacterium]|nr:hypothetical protein [Oscillospiraceae bacterium]